MSDSIFTIGAEGVNATAIVEEIQKKVADNMELGVYTDVRVARAERTNLANLKNEDNFLAFYLECLRDAVFVDINDFEIHEQRSKFNKPLVLLKKSIWKMLKFYTYRMWSQQNQVNGLLLSALESAESKNQEKITALEARITELEAKNS
jgi:hypothetical protein